MSTSWWSKRKQARMIHPLRTMNGCTTFNGNPSNIWMCTDWNKITLHHQFEQINSSFSPFCPQRPCTHCFQLSWTATHSPARRRRRRRRMELEVQRERRKRERKERWMTCPPYQPKLPGWWKCTAVPWCCPGRRVCPRHSPPKPLATSSSSPTRRCSTLCWREVRGHRLKRANVTLTLVGR